MVQINSFMFLGYYGGVSRFVKRIIEDPENPVNYIPVALNIVSGLGQIAYKLGKKKGLESVVE